MILDGLSPLALLGSVLGAALLLFLLQRLRVRYRPQVVETTLFWREALEERRARTLVRRFRHPWAYVLLVLIAALLLFAFAGPRLERDPGRSHLVLLDGRSSAFAQDALEQELAHLPPDRRTVVLTGSRPRTVLLPGEHVALLAKRLESHRAEANVPRFETVIRTFATFQDEVTVTIFGDGEVDSAILSVLPESWKLRRVVARDDDETANVDTVPELVTFAQGHASSSRYGEVDVLVRVRSASEVPVQVEARIGDTAVTPAQRSRDAQVTELRFENVRATGDVFEIDYSVGASTRSASLCLLDRRPIPVMVSPEVPAALVRYLESDPGTRITAQDGEVVIRLEGSSYGGDLPAFELSTSRTEGGEAFLFLHEGKRSSETVLHEVGDALGLDHLDGRELAERLQRNVVVRAEVSTRRMLRVWREVLELERGFSDSLEFAVLCARAVRWLAGVTERPECVSVGRTLALGEDRIVRPDGSATTSLGDFITPVQSGVYETRDGAEVFAASHQLPAFVGEAAALEEEQVEGVAPSLLDWVLFLVLVLLGIEWFLARSSRIP